MEVVEMLDNLKEKARRDPALREMLLATRREKEPLAAFCKKCRELGVPVYEMDLIAAGEEFYAAMKRSTNGGGENSPMLEGEDDFYELFFCWVGVKKQSQNSASIYFSSTGNCTPPIFSTWLWKAFRSKSWPRRFCSEVHKSRRLK